MRRWPRRPAAPAVRSIPPRTSPRSSDRAVRFGSAVTTQGVAEAAAARMMDPLTEVGPGPGATTRTVGRITRARAAQTPVRAAVGAVATITRVRAAPARVAPAPVAPDRAVRAPTTR